MTHLYIEQATDKIEEVSSSIISKLYELAISGDLDNTSDLKGRLHSSTARDIHVAYLNEQFLDLYISADTLYLTFEDSDVESAIANYIGTGGNVSLSDIQAFIISGRAFGNSWLDARINETRNWVSLLSTRLNFNTFDEFRLFEGVTAVHSNAFKDCGQLTSIQLPSSITTINSEAFSGCTSLTNINLSNVTKLFSSVFDGCSNLASVDMSKLTEIGSDCFRNCGITGDISIPDLAYISYRAFFGSSVSRVLDLGDITILTDSCFSKCTNLTEVVLPSSCSIIEQGAFGSCTSLSSINVENVTKMGRNVFNNTPNLSSQVMYFKELLSYLDNTRNNGLFTGGFKYVYSPKLQSCPGGYDVGGNNVRGLFVQDGYNQYRTNKNIVYLKNVSSVETGAFCGGFVKNLIINNSIPPTVTAYVNQKQDLLIDVSGTGTSSVLNVWVPDAAVSDYKNHTYWGEFGNKIQGISGLSKVATKALWDQLSSSAQEDTLIEEYM